ncbi:MULTISPECIES: flagellar hook protein FlgE [unclassified Thiomonas]|uniref:flagellar hook protein FlgE n=1 Tax=unclassified Thiomonas TaxID=2625466 RepID=UPI0004DBCA33|nr:MULTISPECIES: flagellar hook protein FlgE [unclassified Thiomonas]MDD5000886.1 flagellar hook protein FlgE [Thiomonas arsenitoxydans]CQR41866.1 Flagellar hook protein FlgE [Thiomonas sp. CB3]CDW95356.1 Flagellar hook protein FlgE [Thiomonas sp. CB2]VDY03652.1 Flagellar hook protein FlgE [Thiomonas sp. Bio17B3]VDY09172.1 Flagellar hook protein FlgE [Thiomonas sp. Sup16B3]
MSTFQTALSGLQAASTDLQVMGNNIANASTVGFKSSNAQFADTYAAAIAGTSPQYGQVGIGTSVATVAQQFSQGNIESTSNPLDVAINGSGFFQFNYNGATVYGRNGQFQLDQNGYIVDAAGGQLIGTPAVSGVLTGGSGPLQITTTTLAPKATTSGTLGLNLNASSTPISSGTTFNINDPTSYNYSTTATVYDSLGTSHLLTTYYALTSGSTDGQKWNVYYSVDGTTSSGSGITSGGPLTIQFTSTGAISGTASGTIGPLSWADGASGSTIALNFAGSTNYNATSVVNSLTTDGSSVGQLSNLSIDPSGVVFGRYTNGQSAKLGLITLTNFKAPQGLQRLGNNYFVPTYASGQPLTGQPGGGGLGVLQSSAVEQSNVDLSSQLVNLIVAQQAYQANAQTIKTQNQVVQTLLSL